MRQRERGLTSSIALECSPIPGACVSTFCIASAASQLSAHAVGASGMAARTQGDGRAAAQRTVVERVDHVVHNPKGLVAVEGAIDLVAVFSHCTPGAGRFLNTGREKSVRPANISGVHRRVLVSWRRPAVHGWPAEVDSTCVRQEAAPPVTRRGAPQPWSRTHGTRSGRCSRSRSAAAPCCS